MAPPAFQDLMKDNHCWGCGSLNEKGFQIKSRWDGDEAVCVWTPRPEHAAGPRHVLNGGVIATVIDCHSICTAVAEAYRDAGRSINSDPIIWYVTGSLKVDFLRPTLIDQPIELRAQIAEKREKKTLVTCTLLSQGKPCAQGEVVAVRVPPAWREAL